MSEPVRSALEALRQISQALPSMTMAKPVSALEDFREAIPLAQYFGQSGEKVPRASAAINKDILEVERLLEEGRHIARHLHGDVVEAARDLWNTLSTHAPQLLYPEPGIRGTAEQHIYHAAALSVTRVRCLVQEAEADLAPATRRLEEIASHQSESVAGSKEVIPGRYIATEPASFSPQDVTVDAHSASSEQSRTQGEQAVAAARSQIGTPYKWGGTSPSGFDCSGLTQWSYKQAGVDIPRTAQSQAVGKKVTVDELQPGDLVVWDGHVAMYSGDGMMIEAGDPVQENPLRTNNMGMTFLGFYRPTG